MHAGADSISRQSEEPARRHAVREEDHSRPARVQDGADPRTRSDDVLLVDEGNTGRSSAAYRLRSGGRITPWPGLATGSTVRFSLLQSPDLRARLEAFRRKQTEAVMAATLPDID